MTTIAATTFKPAPLRPPHGDGGTKQTADTKDATATSGSAAGHLPTVGTRQAPPKPLPPIDKPQKSKDGTDIKRPGAPAMNVPIALQSTALLLGFDRNHDGAISIAQESATFVGSKTDGSTVSIERLARVADNRGNQDGLATQAELEAVMVDYDQGDPATPGVAAGDHMLGGSEYRNWVEDLGPQRSASPASVFRDLIHTAHRPISR
jgi:hypothetical protein